MFPLKVSKRTSLNADIPVLCLEIQSESRFTEQSRMLLIIVRVLLKKISNLLLEMKWMVSRLSADIDLCDFKKPGTLTDFTNIDLRPFVVPLSRRSSISVIEYEPSSYPTEDLPPVEIIPIIRTRVRKADPEEMKIKIQRKKPCFRPLQPMFENLAPDISAFCLESFVPKDIEMTRAQLISPAWENNVEESFGSLYLNTNSVLQLHHLRNHQ